MGRVHYDFTGERVLVTGASRGIGRAIAEGYAAAGAEVILLADEPAVVDAAATIAKTTGRSCRGVECDITDSHAVEAAVAEVGAIDGDRVNVYPVKGYSITVQLEDAESQAAAP
jgi:3-hydroxybutyrate dehydrogenase